MHITIALSEDLLERARDTAEQRGQSIDELVAEALERDLQQVAPDSRSSVRTQFPLFQSNAPGTLQLTSEDIAAMERAEDLRRHGHAS